MMNHLSVADDLSGYYVSLCGFNCLFLTKGIHTKIFSKLGSGALSINCSDSALFTFFLTDSLFFLPWMALMLRDRYPSIVVILLVVALQCRDITDVPFVGGGQACSNTVPIISTPFR